MKLFLIPLISFLYIAISNAENKECPIMVGDEIDEEEVVEFEGKKVYFCCTACVKIWDKNPKYIIKAMPKLLPQFSGMDEKLGLDNQPPMRLHSHLAFLRIKAHRPGLF